MSEESSNEKDKPKITLERLGINTLGGIIGAFIAVSILFETGFSIPEYISGIAEGGFFLFILLPVLLSFPAALIKNRALSFSTSLFGGGFGVIVGVFLYFITHGTGV